MKKFFKIAGIILLLLVVFALAGIAYVKTALPDVGDPQEITIEKTPARIERGKYLANHVTVCMDCHSARDMSLYAGPLVPGDLGGGGEKFSADMGFPGNFYSRNITPYGIGEWTDGEVFRAVTTGVSRDGHALFPVMPYHGYGQLDQEDLYSIIAYVRSLAPVKRDIPTSVADFPVNLLLNTMPSKANPGKRPLESDTVAYGKYMVLAAGCVECHSKHDKGARVPGTEFGGGMQFKLPTGLAVSANITANKKDGIGTWTQEAFVKRFQAYADSNYVPPKVAPNGANTPMPWMMYAHMKENDLKAIYAYLRTVPVQDNAVVKFTPYPAGQSN
ncbi:c-type cytochrome [Dyadobacter arcticus]|uniref:Mono/diheme cytochrome c family protein n=1 Tax=Dyadobacter arcticus TaxID=1078754 RepID=A0ABX0UPR9_9BACT|nr:c-type cytochrome [Dyadobacter arcticus]NIJ54992.1 mono/diheme cytochrome c family protein [Dyadobacter arcticus]